MLARSVGNFAPSSCGRLRTTISVEAMQLFQETQTFHWAIRSSLLCLLNHSAGELGNQAAPLGSGVFPPELFVPAVSKTTGADQRKTFSLKIFLALLVAWLQG